ncbi:LacI family transcriptional regulator [Aquimarina sp. BL5]|uniref:LacI family DNA-binding transcriptional regulator n=1 Tax=Aquimarina sp. BL5 TaxID=1714860 RepID=UPI000E4A5F36|nr:LacI family DNA-binding transcriptional regulator [Aquimarina sp. BL5]AXT52478.1 LacI family transcriptional regulator [Aquimarina sp. BL5]RKM93848.1 LacI family DNA-binding transcriptional regulator [Aquimarina sp. BL5]
MGFKKRRVKLEDIARKLNVSIATVSRALDKNPRVKASTQEKVFNTAKSMGYMPNQIAKSLSSGKTNIIGVLIPRYDEPFFIEVCRGIDQYARNHNYKILISSSRNSYEFEKENLISFERGLVDGIILSPTHETENVAHLNDLINKGMPMVLFDNIREQVSGADHVMIDDKKASFEAVEFLIKKGKKKIAFIGGIKEKKVFQDRHKGFIAALTEYDIPVYRELILHCNSLHREFEDKEILDFFKHLSTTPDAVFACTDNYGLLTMKTLLKMGKKIPEEVAVIGFGDLGLGEIFVPTLTCISQPSFEMGQKAAELLINQLNEPDEMDHKKTIIRLKTQLTEREST